MYTSSLDDHSLRASNQVRRCSTCRYRHRSLLQHIKRSAEHPLCTCFSSTRKASSDSHDSSGPYQVLLRTRHAIRLSSLHEHTPYISSERRMLVMSLIAVALTCLINETLADPPRFHSLSSTPLGLNSIHPLLRTQVDREQSPTEQCSASPTSATYQSATRA